MLGATTISAIEQELLAYTGTSDVEQGVELMAWRYRENATAFRGDDSLEAIASYLGVKTIRTSDIPCDGLLRPLSCGGYEIELAADITPQRRRFTLAHEIGHVMIHKLMPETRAFETRTVFQVPGSRVEERLCDMFAAAMLLPSDRVSECVGTSKPTIPLLRHVARTFGTSLTAATLRVRDIIGEDIGLAMGVVQDERLALKKVLVDLNRPRLRKSAASLRRLDRSLRESAQHNRAGSGPAWLTTGTRSLCVFCEIAPSHGAKEKLLLIRRVARLLSGR